jgi:hypothetical protein
MKKEITTVTAIGEGKPTHRHPSPHLKYVCAVHLISITVAAAVSTVTVAILSIGSILVSDPSFPSRQRRSIQ